MNCDAHVHCILCDIRELVRKKAIMTMYHFYKISPGSVTHLEDDFRRALSDQDPGVMEAALVLFRDMTKVGREGERGGDGWREGEGERERERERK